MSSPSTPNKSSHVAEFSNGVMKAMPRCGAVASSSLAGSTLIAASELQDADPAILSVKVAHAIATSDDAREGSFSVHADDAIIAAGKVLGSVREEVSNEIDEQAEGGDASKSISILDALVPNSPTNPPTELECEPFDYEAKHDEARPISTFDEFFPDEHSTTATGLNRVKDFRWSDEEVDSSLDSKLDTPLSMEETAILDTVSVHYSPSELPKDGNSLHIVTDLAVHHDDEIPYTGRSLTLSSDDGNSTPSTPATSPTTPTFSLPFSYPEIYVPTDDTSDPISAPDICANDSQHVHCGLLDLQWLDMQISTRHYQKWSTYQGHVTQEAESPATDTDNEAPRHVSREVVDALLSFAFDTTSISPVCEALDILPTEQIGDCSSVSILQYLDLALSLRKKHAWDSLDYIDTYSDGNAEVAICLNETDGELYLLPSPQFVSHLDLPNGKGDVEKPEALTREEPETTPSLDDLDLHADSVQSATDPDGEADAESTFTGDDSLPNDYPATDPPFHHFNLIRYPVYQASRTPSAVSLWVSLASNNKTPRPNDPVSWKAVVLSQATKWVDPCLLHEDAEIPDELTRTGNATALRNFFTGQTSIQYEPVGTWCSEMQDPDYETPSVVDDDGREILDDSLNMFRGYPGLQRPHHINGSEEGGCSFPSAKLKRERGWESMQRLGGSNLRSVLDEDSIRSWKPPLTTSPTAETVHASAQAELESEAGEVEAVAAPAAPSISHHVIAESAPTAPVEAEQHPRPEEVQVPAASEVEPVIVPAAFSISHNVIADIAPTAPVVNVEQHPQPEEVQVQVPVKVPVPVQVPVQAPTTNTNEHADPLPKSDTPAALALQLPYRHYTDLSEIPCCADFGPWGGVPVRVGSWFRRRFLL